MTEFSLPRKITLATDLSARSDRAFDRTIALAQQWDAEVQLVHAVEDTQYAFWVQGPTWRRSPDPVAIARRKLETEFPGWSNVRGSLVVKNSAPYTLVTESAQQAGSDLIITGIAHDETYGADKIGRMVTEIAKHSQAPVLAVKRRVAGPYRNIVVASDLTDVSRHAMMFAAGAFRQANVSIFYGFDVPYADKLDNLDNVERDLRASETANAQKWVKSVLGEAADEINVIAEMGQVARNLGHYVSDWRVDLVVVGSEGRTGLLSAILGSTAEEIMTKVDCDVMVVRPG
jgi:nucleotide-binding universal stress UspA family protein